MLDSGSHSSSSAADRLIRDKKQHEKVVQLWIFLGCVLGFLTLLNIFCTLHSYLGKRTSVSSRQQGTGIDKEKQASIANPTFWVRSSSALATTSRILSFRLLIPIGFGAHLLFSELAFICFYMASLLIWLLVDSTLAPQHFMDLLFKFSSPQSDYNVLRGPRCSLGFLPTPAYCGTGGEKQYNILLVRQKPSDSPCPHVPFQS